jgi:hypothetical protein
MAAHPVAKGVVPIRQTVRLSRRAQEGPERPPRPRKYWSNRAGPALVGLSLPICSGARAQCPDPGASPYVVDPNLAVRTVVDHLDAPTGMAFLPNNDVDLDLLVLGSKRTVLLERRPA